MLNSSNQLILQGCLEVLAQASQMLESLNDEQYQKRPGGKKSCIGEHFRHLFDLFESVKAGVRSGLVDYDIRSRGSKIESERSVGLSLCDSMTRFFTELNDTQFEETVDVKTEVTLAESHSVKLRSSIHREIIFATAHAVHHFAIIREIAASLGCELPSDYGLAPATRSFLRNQA